jgi:hypothetical protein
LVDGSSELEHSVCFKKEKKKRKKKKEKIIGTLKIKKLYKNLIFEEQMSI